MFSGPDVTGMAGLVAYVLLALVFSFLCSVAEAVLLSVTPSYAQVKLREGSAIGKRLQNHFTGSPLPLRRGRRFGHLQRAIQELIDHP